MHPDNTYLCHCFNNIEKISDLSNVILLEIFKVWSEKPDWLKEYRILVKIMGIKPNYQFFKQLDAIPVFENRLDFVIGASREEQIYLLRMVGRWMRTDPHQVLSSERLKEIYPELFAYLDDENMPFDDEIKCYMAKYKAYKLENSLPDDEATYFNQIQTDIYDMRYSILSEYLDSDTIILWIDALGIEWFPLLHWALSKYCNAEIKAEAIGQACLPTETMFNDQWEKMNYPYEKLDKLDKLAHKGVIDEPDYYACVQEQLSFVSGICHKVTELMRQHRRIIITGDHGTSRLAARFFHNRDAMPLPKNAKACSHGRYCLIGTESFLPVLNTQVVAANGNKYAIFRNYDHFTQSGFAAGADDSNAIYGEVHGGATPEEMLVPIVVLDSNQAIPLIGKWLDNTVKISMKKVKLQIIFNHPVNHLQAKIAGIDGETLQTSDAKRWNIIFRGLEQGTHSAQIYADGKILTLPDVIIKPSLGGGEGDLPL